MSTATELDTSILAALDFRADLPCSYREHDQLHQPGGPAEWVVTVVCTACGRAGRTLICNTGKERKLMPGVMVTCPVCDEVGYWADFVVCLERITR